MFRDTLSLGHLYPWRVLGIISATVALAVVLQNL